MAVGVPPTKLRPAARPVAGREPLKSKEQPQRGCGCSGSGESVELTQRHYCAADDLPAPDKAAGLLVRQVQASPPSEPGCPPAGNASAAKITSVRLTLVP